MWNKLLNVVLLVMGIMAFTLNLPARSAAQAPPPAAPPVLTTGVLDAGLLDDSHLLCLTFDDTFAVLDLASGTTAPWRLAWDARQAGWEMEGGGGFGWKLAVSPDGRHVALARTVATPHPDPEGDYMDNAVAVILAGPTGAGARCVGLSEPTDGGPPLSFTQDSSRLYGPWFFPCPPTPDGFRKYVAANYMQDTYLNVNYITTGTGEGGTDSRLPDFEFYDKCPLSDNFVYEGLDEPGLSFASFAGGGVTGVYSTGQESTWGWYEWVLPDGLLVNQLDGTQRLVRLDGAALKPVPGVWHCYASMPDGTCLFSDDRGASVKYGKVDWTTFTVDWWVGRPDLARFAEPLGEAGMPERLNKWLPLGDSSGVVIIDPGEGDVVLARLSREGAKP